MTGILILCALAAFVALLALRALAMRPPVPASEAPAPIAPVDADGAASRLSRLIRARTVSSRDPDGWDPKEFDGFRGLLPGLYPKAHGAMELELIAGHSMLYRWKGKGRGEPLVLMSHYDVVPASDEGWTRPPFSGDLHDGKVWGRGAIDTKCTLVCALEAIERLVEEGFVPERDVYLSFGHNEEIGGDGAPAIVAHLAAKGVKPGLVLDEGGAVVEGVFPGVSRPLAMVGVAEKGVTDVELSVKSAGGHSSTPPWKGASWRIARAVMRLEARPFPAGFPEATKAMFSRLGPHASFGLRLVFANMWLFEPLLLRVFGKAGGELNAMCRTTAAVTMLEGSPAANVLPAVAKAVVNVRIAIGQTVDTAVARMKDVIDDPLVEMRVLLPGEPSPVSELSGPGFDALTATISDVYPAAVVAPYVVMGGTDARHFSRASSTVYRFSPFEFSKAERASMHAVNEAIPVASLAKGVEFYARLIRRVG
ncbi:MAG: M20 family peptidase [Spirochaetes bacterium]|nr:M20 family peptidase [Spirochaetota bacterium]MBU1080152.1 M20 family peptidase [Spirochaetota bacterium]